MAGNNKKNSSKAKKKSSKPGRVDMNNVLRLPTTVQSTRRDFSPALAKTVKSDASYAFNRVVTQISGVAKRLNSKGNSSANKPSHQATPAWANRKVNKKLKKLAHKATRGHRNSGRSKLPMIAVLALLIGGGAFYGYTKLDQPLNFSEIKLAGYFNLNKWTEAIKSPFSSSDSKNLITENKVKKQSIFKNKIKNKSIKKKISSAKKRKFSNAVKKYKKSSKKSFSKMSKSEKQRAWKTKLAKIKKSSQTKSKSRR